MPDDLGGDDFEGFPFDFAIDGYGHESVDYGPEGERHSVGISRDNLSGFLAFFQNLRGM